MNNFAQLHAALHRSVQKILPSPVPRRQTELTGQYAKVDGIKYVMPVNSDDSPVLMAAFPINKRAAAALLPGKEMRPFSLGGKGLLVVTVVNYKSTDIGKYIEYSLAIAITHGSRPVPPILPLIFQKTFKLGQFVVDLPVSTEISVKGGKGIWGMPKHQANLDFVVTDTTVSAQYDQDGMLGCYIEIEQPAPIGLPVRLAASNYCAFRGMLWKSDIYFEATANVAFGRQAKARLVLGDAPGVVPLKTLQVGNKPLFTAWLPEAHGVLDDHYEAWFLTATTEAEAAALRGGDMMDSVVGLGQSQEWLAPPDRSRVADSQPAQGRAS
ncbi:acetoacetate decarboxylase family protein [Arthrobacter sp. MMS18-M83]|uniref:acetoacetate decarboxylase family protein n=1 Tax=Arthrobacter sp. MMS18-M83 TaxID=2996261 RepID=UPI00227CAEA2|nr:acetoacetate decarboxylase family protein [Arthrobacter sp. MMS18-M83]WAH98340.1 acetoacetate decarboxylase family protein [Arthrobacter sp. MMS18-M83]